MQCSRRFGLQALVAIVALSSLPASAQQSTQLVLPASEANRDANRWMDSHFRSHGPRRIQILIDESQLRAFAGKQIHELAFRKDVKKVLDYATLRGGETLPMRITASWSDANFARPSMTFAQNRGLRVSKVFDGDLALPKVSGQPDARIVASFAASEAPTIRFAPAIRHESGKTLVLEFESRLSTSSYAWSWPIDSLSAVQRGTMRVIGSACWDAKTRPATARVVTGHLRPGMHVRFNSDAPPEPVAAFMLFGLSDKTAFGSVPLPIRLAGTACDLFVSPDFIVPTTFFAGGSKANEGWTATVLPTPSDSFMFGATLYLQYVFLHHENSRLAIKTSNGVAATFTTQVPKTGISLVVSADVAAQAGRVFLDFAPVMRLLAK